MGWSELMGIANRTDFDLKQHSKFSGKSLTYFDEERKEHVVPFVIEPSAGVDRALLAFLLDAYREEEVRGEKRTVLRFHPELAPVKIAVLPLLKKRSEIVTTCHDLRTRLAKRWITLYDDTAAIGRLYRRQDEVGTPYCVTVDVKTVGDAEKGEAGDQARDDSRARLDGADPGAHRRARERVREAAGRDGLAGRRGGLPARGGLSPTALAGGGTGIGAPCVTGAETLGTSSVSFGGAAAGGSGAAGCDSAAEAPQLAAPPAREPTTAGPPGAGGSAGAAPGGASLPGTLCRRGPQPTAGSVPRTKAIGTTRTHSFDGSRSTGTSTMRSGIAKSSLGLSPRTLPM